MRLFVYSYANGIYGKRAVLMSTSTSRVALSQRPSSGSCPSTFPRAPATAWTKTTGRPHARLPSAPSVHLRVQVHLSPPHAGTSCRPPTPLSTHNITRSTRYRASCAISPLRIRNRSLSCRSAIVAREGKCSRLRSQPRAPLVGHTTRIRRSCWTGKGRSEKAPVRAVGFLSRAHSMLERSVVSLFRSASSGNFTKSRGSLVH
jgi:hypothetical protein